MKSKHRRVKAGELERRRLALPTLKHAAGKAAGIEYAELLSGPGTTSSRVRCIDYCPETYQVQEPDNIVDFLARHRPEWSKVRWIHVEGLEDRAVLRAFAEKYQLHPLAVEDLLDGHQRPKVEDYPGTGDFPGRLFIVARTARFEDGKLVHETVGFFLGRHTLLTFQHGPGLSFAEIQRRIANDRSRLRENDVSFLLYSLIDVMVDRLFPILERYSERLEAAEEDILRRPHLQNLETMHDIKRELVLLRRAIWPMRDLVAQLQRDRHECLSETTATYFRDVYDHCVQILDLLETYREIAAAMTETYVSVMSNRTNDIMKVLTVIGTIFIPLTFLAGVYGMNMPIPENQYAISYPLFWLVSLALGGLMLFWFRRRGWL